MVSTRDITIINVPSDIGSMIKGKHLAPGAFESGDFAGKLRDVGYTVNELDALSKPQIWSSEATFNPNGVRNEESNVQVNHEVKKAVGNAIESGFPSSFPIVVGGECNIRSGHISAPKRIGLLYVDGDADLVIPNEAGSSGNLASMTFTHLTLREGALKSMHPFSRPDGRGVWNSTNTVIFGLSAAIESNTRSQLAYIFDEGYRVMTSTSVAQDPSGRTQQALEWLEEKVDCFLIHLDVDAIDGSLFPLANVPNRTGAEFEKIMAAMNIFLGSSKACGMCIAEVNPYHDPGLKMTSRLVEATVRSFKERFEKA